MDVLSPAGCVIFHNEKNELANEGLVGGLVAINFLFSQKYWVAIIIPIDEL